MINDQQLRYDNSILLSFFKDFSSNIFKIFLDWTHKWSKKAKNYIQKAILLSKGQKKPSASAEAPRKS